MDNQTNASNNEIAVKLGFFSDLTEKLYNLMDNPRIKYSVLGFILIVVVLYPLVGSDYTINVMWTAMFYMLLCMGLNVIVGYTGMCDFGYAAKFAVGAYTTAILIKWCGWSFWLTLPVSVVTSVIAAFIIGGPVLRLRSDYLAIVTLGFGEIARTVARNLTITGSATGLNAIPRPSFFGIPLTQGVDWYYIFVVLVVIFVIVTNRLKNSRFGRALQYIREDEDAAEAMGINTTRYKLFAFIVGTVLGGLAGSFFAVKMTAISPNDFQYVQSANIMLAVVLGGMGRTVGVIVGAAFFSIFPELFRDVPVVGNARMLFFGLLLITVMIFRPQGLWPERKR